MIDPSNREPMPGHHVPFARVLSIVAFLTLLALAVYLVIEKRKATEEVVVPIPTPEEIRENSPFPDYTQDAFRTIQDRYARGDITREEAERQMEELFADAPSSLPAE